MTLFCDSFVTYFLYFKQLNIGLQGVSEEPREEALDHGPFIVNEF